MKKIVIVALLIASSFLYANDMAEAKNSTTFQSKTWDVGLLACMIGEGSDGDYLDNSAGVGLHVGYRYTENWSAVLEISSIKDAADAIDDIDVVDYVLGATYDLTPENDFFTPYVSVALGYRTISDVTDGDTWNIIPGLGLKFLATDSLQVFLEGKARWSLENDEKGLMGTLGVSYRFN